MYIYAHTLAMNLRLLLFICLLTVSCRTNTTTAWQTLDFKAFKIKTPKGWKEFKQQGIDSYVGGLTNGKDSLWFDYGWYSPDIGDEDPSKHKLLQDTVNGLVARIVIPVKQGDGYIRMYIRVNEEDKFSMGGYNMQQTDTILKMFNSVVFNESDTSINTQLTSADFKNFATGSGRTLYINNCASCHAVHKKLTGPALAQRVNIRSSEWVYRFLTNRKSMGNDTVNVELRKEFGISCTEFPKLTREQVEQIYDYIKE